MRYKVEFLPSAWEDLKEITSWYSFKFGKESARKVTKHILEAIERLEVFPDSGSMTPDKWLNEQGYRMVITLRHIAIYKKIKETVYIYHVADYKTDYIKLFEAV